MSEYQQEQFPIPTPGRLRRELRLRRPPWWMVLGLIVVITATWIPLYLIFKQRNSFSTLPKIHYIQDMDNQPSFGAQAPSALFADGRATRSHVAGTVARGNLRDDDHFFRGYQMVGQDSTEVVEFFQEIPDAIKMNDSLIARGAERYDIYCAVCHDSKGQGNGLVHQHAMALQEPQWVPPTNLLTQEIRDRPAGQLFQAMSDGVRNMPGYKTQINVEDRWAIVAYVRQLQAVQPIAVIEKVKASE